jgi:hypothetical protein
MPEVAMPGPLRAGVAAVNITSPVGNYLQGYTRGKPSIGVHLDIYAKAIVFADGAAKAALVTTDLIGLEAAHVAMMREEVSRWTDIPPDHVMINASHSHGGPTVQGLGQDPWGWLWGNPPDLDYARELAKKIGGLVAMADRSLRPAALGFGTGEACFNISRRRPTPEGTILAPNPDGVCDHRVKVVKIVDRTPDTPDGGDRPAPAPRAILCQFTCHPTIMAMANLEISPDYPGVAQAFAEQAYGGGPTSGTGLPDGPGTLVLFAQGCCGDIRPNLTTEDGQSFRPGTKRDAHRLGRILGAEVVKICEETAAGETEGSIRVASTRITLPYARLPERRRLEELAATGDHTHGGHLDVDGRPFGDAVWARLVLAKLDQGSLPAGIEVELQALRIGDLTIVGLPGEVFAEIGFQIEAAIAGPSLILGYTNGNHGYFCTQSSYEGGGYEPAFSWMLYMHPAQFEPSNEHRLVAAGREVAARVGTGSSP